MKLIHKEDENINSLEEFRYSLSDELRAAEQKFYHLFDFNPCPMSVHDSITGAIIDVNQAFVDALGFESKIQIIGKTVKDYEVLPQKESGIFLKKIMEDGIVRNMLIPFRSLKGRKIKGLFSGTYIELNGNKCLLIICQVIKIQCLLNYLIL